MRNWEEMGGGTGRLFAGEMISPEVKLWMAGDGDGDGGGDDGGAAA